MKASKISVAIACGMLVASTTPRMFASQAEGITSYQTDQQTPRMSLEALLNRAKERHPDMQVINTYSETTQKGRAIEKIYYLRHNKSAWIMTLNSSNGNVLEDHLYKFPEQAEVIPLETILHDVKSKYHVNKIVRTRLEQEDGRKLRIIYYIDKLKQHRTMVVDGKTGTVLSDKARKMVSTG
ncbi:MAG: hypothetical protein KAG53_07985 [Endozoicomonadaceae bacterium]|nr:hypothetical protein [Endozoicomonadaceae bacterium]